MLRTGEAGCPDMLPGANSAINRVILSDGNKTEGKASRVVKIKTVWKYNSPTFGLNKVDYAYHNKYS